jgi:mRNA-degrading endonuclease YafQ of YafQ-DinJ toxin-antitoxin module
MQLLRSDTFIKRARKLVTGNRRLALDLGSALRLLEDDPFHATLRTHKLKGKLAGSWACSAGFDLRIVFKFVDYQGVKAILLETIGTHEEVY